MSNVREYRSTTFALLFSDRKEALSLCNALYGTDYTEEDEVSFNTLTNKDGVRSGFCAAIADDLAFIVRDYQHVFEHQSTVSPNMPLRMLEYFVEILKKSVLKGKDRYKTKRLMIPSPRFVVFYNGRADQPDEVMYRLSDSFKVHEGEPAIELVVRVLNINIGHNRELMEKCRVLKEYAEFTGEISRRLPSGVSEGQAKDIIRDVCEECIRKGILREFLMEHMEEIIMAEWWEYDARAHDEAIGDENFEEGLREGLQQGWINGLLDMVRDGIVSYDVAAQRAEKKYNISKNDFEKMLNEYGKTPRTTV